MNQMTPETWATIAGVGVTCVLALGGMMFQMGRHSQRLSALEEKTKDLSAVAVLSAALVDLKEQLGEIRKDVKDLLAGRAGRARRAAED